MSPLHSIKAHSENSLTRVVIEVPLGSQAKIEYNPELDIFSVDRFLYTTFIYPFNYGFVPETWSEDNDPLDAVVISSQAIPTGSLVEVRVIGMLVAHDEEGTDNKLITVPSAKIDPSLENINTIEDLDKNTLEKIEHFYKNYKIIEPGKWVDIDGYQSLDEAQKLLRQSIDRYHQHFNK